MSRKMKKVIFLLTVCFGLFVNCSAQHEENQKVEIFNTVWNTINTEYFDTTFNGLNWEEVHDYYLPLIESCSTKDSLYDYLNEMVFKLNVSHLGVVPPEEANEVGDPQLFFNGTIGIDIRFIAGEAVIISVLDNSPAEEAGLKPGFVIIEVNGKSVSSFKEEKEENPTPPFNERNLRSLISQNISAEFFGTPGDTVKLKYEDGNGNHSLKKLLLKDRGLEKIDIIPGMPAMYASVCHKAIDSSIAYICFDAFLPHILDSTISAIRKYNKFQGIIIDLRGNPGGVFDVRKAIAEQFVDVPTLFWKYFRRGNVNEVYLNPSETPFQGSLVVLIDELSTSSSEEFSGGMKAIKRATIIGQQTPGKVLTMEVVPLPEGAFFVYPNQQTLTSKDEVLEAVGVVPHYSVNLSKEELLKGIDTQLEKAIEYLKKNQ
jgi:carboxyl-terminal processing protease